jgi:glycosyltransferase involved in cell wall biosynthesis
MRKRADLMRIVHVTNNAEATTPGIERRVTSLAIAQKARGSDVMIAIDRPGVFAETCLAHRIQVTVNSDLIPDGGPGTAPTESAINDFTATLTSFAADIVHCHSPSAARLGIAAGKRANIVTLFTGDGPSTILEAKRRGIGLPSAVICLTPPSYQILKNKVPEVDLYLVPTGTKVWPRTHARETVSAGTVSLTFAGSLTWRKGADTAILAMAELRRKLNRSCPTLNIYGDGDQREYLAEMTAALELDDFVRFHGFKLDALEHCPSTDILIMSSRTEVGPLVVLEAMSRGMPIVATDVGEVANMLPDRRYGRVVPPDSEVELAEAIESLLADIASRQFDPDLLIERHRSHYSLEKWAENIDAVYNQILLNAGGSHHDGRSRTAATAP